MSASPIWLVIPDYDLQSRNHRCSVSGLPKRQDDVGVFRPKLADGYIDEEGFADISQAAIEEAATLLGWVPESEAVENLKLAHGRLLFRTSQDAAKIKGLEARVQELEHLLQNSR